MAVGKLVSKLVFCLRAFGSYYIERMTEPDSYEKCPKNRFESKFAFRGRYFRPRHVLQNFKNWILVFDFRTEKKH